MSSFGPLGVGEEHEISVFLFFSGGSFGFCLAAWSMLRLKCPSGHIFGICFSKGSAVQA